MYAGDCSEFSITSSHVLHVFNYSGHTGSVPEVPVELPLLPGSLSLSEVVELQTNSDEQLEEGHGSQQSVSASDGPVIAVRPCHTQLHTHTHYVTR